ncbi:hypothetical protein [Natrinema salaciae]|uniref:hypothetical protein n=1 Tax=Natrinema salaciae TaxID=1186196 RepID=UPI000B89A1BA|nr:hypothetical protein [Natrinema salaciae]
MEYHRRADHEDRFSVLEGTATFETEGGDVTVNAAERTGFEPDERQLGRNEMTNGSWRSYWGPRRCRRYRRSQDVS